MTKEDKLTAADLLREFGEQDKDKESICNNLADMLENDTDFLEEQIERLKIALEKMS